MRHERYSLLVLLIAGLFLQRSLGGLYLHQVICSPLFPPNVAYKEKTCWRTTKRKWTLTVILEATSQ